MNDFVGHGYAVVDIYTDTERGAPSKASLHIGHLPGRKQICLYGHNGNPSCINVYAFFPSEEKAAQALAILDRLMKR